ncbi:glutamate-5-semialdehyde dehydrogenase [Cecembia calidifontis]|jgi:glutamate-5-semialdehyde dehydrogenase|uniref:Gamma-glutamyl phosphate reductase n=1 Tax=Cecembia calidifontis TaxID=1187080 RepID=A0A4Q7PGL4_9BACT|nr:glutamate-5-semialdehyde dehydrogenase [Cecembia calidifontis]RZS98052.1 glutamate-5-semialdehyde dehydrogenase [Cecembia calidifontis]
MIDFEIIFKAIKNAARKLNQVTEKQIQGTLDDLVILSKKAIPDILDANKEDLAKMDPKDPKYDRLLLTEERILAILKEVIQVKNLPSPLGLELEKRSLDNGLELRKITVPLGVLGIIYEARPNVTYDVFCLALKSGNALVLKGGSDADHSNRAIMKVIHESLEQNGIPTDAYKLLPPDRKAAQALMEAVGYVDVIIPRGSQGLIDFVRSNSKVPVIETGAGIVHTYFDETADLEKGKSIILNAKTRRPSVCNSLDCLIIHESRLDDSPLLVQPLLEKEVILFADNKAFNALPSHPLIQKASPEHFGTEFLSLKMAIRTVENLDQALDHIAKYSSHHSEAIISESPLNIERFLNEVDAAAVYANASTAFTDGNQFGLGAEIGISTQKLHARGPMALKELTSYKWVIKGNGQIRV